MPKHARAKPGNVAGGQAQRNVRRKGARFYPCPVCDELRGVRISKSDKPYLHCDECGLQLFMRCAPGIARFWKRCVSGNAPEVRAPKTAHHAERIVAELADLRERRAKLSGLFASNDAKQAAAVFAREIKALESELAKLAKPKRAKRRKPRKRSKAKRKARA